MGKTYNIKTSDLFAEQLAHIEKYKVNNNDNKKIKIAKSLYIKGRTVQVFN